MSCRLERLTLDSLAEVILHDPAMPIARSADHNIPQADIMLFAGRTASNADHQTNLDVGEVVRHICGNRCCRSRSVLSKWQGSNDNIVFSDAPKGIVALVGLRDSFGPAM